MTDNIKMLQDISPEQDPLDKPPGVATRTGLVDPMIIHDQPKQDISSDKSSPGNENLASKELIEIFIPNNVPTQPAVTNKASTIVISQTSNSVTTDDHGSYPISSVPTQYVTSYAYPYQGSMPDENRKVSDEVLNGILKRAVINSLQAQQKNAQVPGTQIHYTSTHDYMSSYSSTKSSKTVCEADMNPYLTPKNTVSSSVNSPFMKQPIQCSKLTATYRELPDDPEPVSAKTEKKHTTAYMTLQRFIRECPMLTIGSNVYVYDTTHYQKKTKLEVEQLINKLCREDIAAAGTSHYVHDVYGLLLQNDILAKKCLEINHDIISFQNGIFNLLDRKFYPHHPSYITISAITCNYTPGADCPVFKAFLIQITGGDTVLQERILQMIGYLLTTRDEAKAIFALQGLTDTGKSILSNLIASMINSDAVCHLDINDLENDFSIALLHEKTLSISADMSSSPIDPKVISKLKKLTGFDTVVGNVKYKDHLTFRSFAKFLLVTNHCIYSRGDDDAFFQRIVTIPFINRIPKENQDKKLSEKLALEKEGIAVYALAAYFRLLENNYIFAGDYSLNEIYVKDKDINLHYSIKNAIKYFAENYLEADNSSGIFTNTVHQAFVDVCGFVDYNLFSQHFGMIIKNLYRAEKKRMYQDGAVNATSYYHGIRFKNLPILK